MIKIIYYPVISSLDYFFYAVYLLAATDLFNIIKLVYERSKIMFEYTEKLAWNFGELRLVKKIDHINRYLVGGGFLYLNIEDIKKKIDEYNQYMKS